jgi:hypothetical protein
MRLFLPHVLYTVWCLSKSYAHNNNFKKLVKKEEKKRKTQQHRYGLMLGLLQLATSIKVFRSFPWSQSKCCAELLASHAALPMVTLNISPYINVTLTFDFDFWLDHPVHGGCG